MDDRLKIKKSDLEKAEDNWDYLYTILNKYYELDEAEPEEFPNYLNNNQLVLFVHSALDREVNNGGFLQLIFNGYAEFVFEDFFIQSLRSWGAASTSDLLESIKPAGLQLVKELQNAGQFDEQRSLEAFSNLAEEHSEFDKFDDTYYEINEAEVKAIRDYVAHHLSDFIIVE